MALAAVSQLLLRHADLLADRVLVNPPVDDFADHAAAHSLSAVLTRDSRVAARYGRSTHVITAGMLWDDPGLLAPGSRICVCMPRERLALTLWLELLAGAFPGCKEWLLAGEKRSGIASSAHALGQQGWQVQKRDSARHCQLWQITPPDDWSGRQLSAHWESFESGFGTVYTLPGVFSHGSLDPGSAMLINTLATRPPARCTTVVDFGAGAGVLGLALFGQEFAGRMQHLHCIDTDQLALRCACRTLALSGRDTDISYHHDHGLREPCDFLISNPPFHTGAPKDLGIGRKLLEETAELLRPHGEIRLVANRFLPYPPLLEKLFGGFEVLARDGKFAVYSAQRGVA